jgi:hypothetical protein
MFEGDTRIERNARAVYRPLADDAGGLLLHLDSGAYHGLNAVGGVVWELLAEGATFSAVVQGVRARFSDAPPALDDDVRHFLDALAARELVNVSDRGACAPRHAPAHPA